MSISANKLYAGYNKKYIINNQEIDIDEGKINIFIGPNGSGKSTIFNALCKQLSYLNGNIFIDDENIDNICIKKLAAKIGILFQENTIPSDITVYDLISYGRFAHIKIFDKFSDNDKNIIKNAMKLTNIEQFQNKQVCELSSGQRQLVWIAMLITQEAKYLFLDEPTTYLDLFNQFEILNCLNILNKNYNKTIIMILHDVNLALQYADKIFIIKDGKLIISGSPQKIITSKLLQDTFNVSFDIVKKLNKMYCIPKKLNNN